jgi:hypothetical protein
MFDPILDAAPPTGPRSCARCGKAFAELILLGESAPAVCDLCADYERRKQGERALAGSPSETAARTGIVLPEAWR